MISHTHRCIFIHIPKTGGTSIEHVIWPGERSSADLWMGFVDRFHNFYQTGGLQHLTAKLIRAHVGASLFADYFKFAIIRNPWDKAASQFRYMASRPDLCEFADLECPPSDFRHYLEAIARKEHVQWMAQHRFVLDDNGESMVDRIGRYENLQSATTRFFAAIGIADVVLSHANRTRDSGVPHTMDLESSEMIGELYRTDALAFGYGPSSSLSGDRGLQ